MKILKPFRMFNILLQVYVFNDFLHHNFFLYFHYFFFHLRQFADNFWDIAYSYRLFTTKYIIYDDSFSLSWLLMYSKASRGVFRKRCFENIQQIYKRALMPKCDFNKVAKQLEVCFCIFIVCCCICMDCITYYTFNSFFYH